MGALDPGLTPSLYSSRLRVKPENIRSLGQAGARNLRARLAWLSGFWAGRRSDLRTQADEVDIYSRLDRVVRLGSAISETRFDLHRSGQAALKRGGDVDHGELQRLDARGGVESEVGQGGRSSAGANRDASHEAGQ